MDAFITTLVSPVVSMLLIAAFVGISTGVVLMLLFARDTLVELWRK
jgi:hypothetical protein